MKVTRTSIWRDIPPTTLAQWEAEFRALGSPFTRGETRAMYDAAGRHSAVVLAFLYREQLHWTYAQSPIPHAYNNPLSIAKPGGGSGVDRWVEFASVADCVREWVRRLNDPNYKNGVYTNDLTLRELIYDYAPPSENDTEAYIDTIISRLAAMPEKKGDTTVPELNMAKGLIPMPGFDDEAGTFTKREGVGCNYLGSRRIDFLFVHRALGRGARGVADWLKRSDVQGLTDFVIDADTAYMIRLVDVYAPNPPTGWAQGPYRKPTTALQKAINRLGGFADYVNRYGESTEVTDFYDDPISDACKRDLAQWIASRAHDRGVRFDQYPYTPEGTQFVFSHWMSCGKDLKICAGSVLDAFVFGPKLDFNSECTKMVVARLKAAQLGQPTPGTTTTPKPKPQSQYGKPLPIKALVSLDLSDRKALAEVKTREGTRFRSVTDQVVAIRNTPRWRVASAVEQPDPKKHFVGPMVKKGEDFAPAWEFTSNGVEWYLTPHWSRILKADTKIVVPEPLKG